MDQARIAYDQIDWLIDLHHVGAANPIITLRVQQSRATNKEICRLTPIVRMPKRCICGKIGLSTSETQSTFGMTMFDARDHPRIEHKSGDRSRHDRPAQQSKLGGIRPSRPCGIAQCSRVAKSYRGCPSYLGVKLFATASALRSSVSRAIFWASMTSPAAR